MRQDRHQGNVRHHTSDFTNALSIALTISYIDTNDDFDAKICFNYLI